MKNKQLTYLLISSVAAVWGIIFYRVFAATKETEDVKTLSIVKPKKYEPLDDYKLKDTFTLVLNYRDPMLGIPAESEELVMPEMPGKAEQPTINYAVPKPLVNPDIIKYTGFILNASGKRIAAIINLNGKELMLIEGQSSQGLKMIRNYRDSVKINYKDQTKYIRLE